MEMPRFGISATVKPTTAITRFAFAIIVFSGSLFLTLAPPLSANNPLDLSPSIACLWIRLVWMKRVGGSVWDVIEVAAGT